jgi:hypothetical protein
MEKTWMDVRMRLCLISRQQHLVDVFTLYCKGKIMPLRHAGAKAERVYRSYTFFTSALDRGEWSASRLDSNLPRERTSVIHWIGGWMGLRSGLQKPAKEEILCLRQGLNLYRPVCSQTLYKQKNNFEIVMYSKVSLVAQSV